MNFREQIYPGLKGEAAGYVEARNASIAGIMADEQNFNPDMALWNPAPPLRGKPLCENALLPKKRKRRNSSVNQVSPLDRG
ncbi:MAG: hypothetical protein WC091_13650 [Sulfuricellaceae bacterium]